jgi:hypothetical protein
MTTTINNTEYTVVRYGAKALHLTGSLYMPTLCGKSETIETQFEVVDADPTCKRCLKSAHAEATKW